MTKIIIPAEVRREVNKQEKRRVRVKKDIFQMANSQLKDDMQAVGIWGERKYIVDEDYIFEGKHLKVLPVLLLREQGQKDGEIIKKRNGFYAVFDVNKCNLDSEIKLWVPADKKGMFIGKDGWLLRMWCEKLGIRKIHVVEL